MRLKPMRLNLKQTKALDYLEDNVTNELLFGGGAGGGKSILLCYAVLKFALKYPNTRWLLGRAKLKTLKETTLNSFFQVCQMQGIGRNEFRYNEQSSIITFKNGSQILLKDLFYYPSDPQFDELGSLEITGGFIDECNQITQKAWTITQSRIRYKLDEYNLIPKLLGTCNPAKNFVYKEFYLPSKNGDLLPYKKFIQSLVTDNPNISKHYIENLQKLDEQSKRRLLFGDWEYDDDPSVLVDYDKSCDIFTNSHVLGGQKYITADIARLGNDKTKIRVWDGLKSILKVTIDRSTLDVVVQAIRKLQQEYAVPNSHTLVDEDGVGGGVVDMLKCKGFINNGRAKNPNYQNNRSECYFYLADLINKNELYLLNESPTDRDIIVEELGVIKQKDIDKDGKLAIIPKDEIKKIIGRSPDEADCIMMRMWFEINRIVQPFKNRFIN